MSSPEVAPAAQMRSGEACVAVVNAGSSSIKFGLYDAAPGLPMLYRGKIEALGVAPRLRVANAEGATVTDRSWAPEALKRREATLEILQTAAGLAQGPAAVVGHRVVHGGADYAEPVRLDPEVIAALRQLAALAPLHQENNLASIEAIAEVAPPLPQVACFDTAFHRTQPALAQLFCLPQAYTDAGVRRYGFHGLSYEYVAGRLWEIAPELAEGRVIVAHLGNGASLCALKGGRSVATTMGFTGLDGLMMGTRCGELDPGVMLHLLDAYGMDARAIEELVYRRSGLLGVSGISSDMRTLRASTEPAAAEAIELFVYRAVREVGSMAAALGGLDGLVFTAGIGEHDARTREDIAAGCAWLGLELDPARNGKGAGRISRDGSAVACWVVHTDEESMIARHAAGVVGVG